MGVLAPRPIEWIQLAPLAIEGRAESTAPPSEVFAVLADHERWPEWFPSVRKVEVLGPAEGVGARRRVHIPGAKIDEEFIVWEPGMRWSFTATAASPEVMTSLVEDCRLEATPNGGTRITYTMYIEPHAGLRLFVKLGAGRMRANNNRAMQNLASRAAARAS